MIVPERAARNAPVVDTERDRDVILVRYGRGKAATAAEASDVGYAGTPSVAKSPPPLPKAAAPSAPGAPKQPLPKRTTEQIKADLASGGCGKDGVPQFLRDVLLSSTCRLRDLK